LFSACSPLVRQRSVVATLNKEGRGAIRRRFKERDSILFFGFLGGELQECGEKGEEVSAFQLLIFDFGTTLTASKQTTAGALR
jgi:hypothetical protein